ncbi:hypothetical protein BJ875DRAFT_379762 [Amylocarpus encephaloides]|uniref:Uncharacterized protein n=1 Tax=Amylocarpus encephaloides TaxID=45428 RepID=A0A9P7YFZ0_9HELO|nr:hypothetical protein BJ875DRAFT_379762 [Amylocarpus encephaloides]
MNPLLRLWFRMLDLPRFPNPTWHRQRLIEELKEVEEAPTQIYKLSESSDIQFNIYRAEYEGLPIQEMPRFTLPFPSPVVHAYMLAKFTSRWTFYRTAAYFANAPHSVHEVINPSKDEKLNQVASRHGMNSEGFRKVTHNILRFCVLFP